MRDEAAYARQYRQLNPEKTQAATARWREKNPLFFKDKHLRRKFGISLDDWMFLFLSTQKSRCACCGSIEPHDKFGWHVDHDHEKKRGDVGFVRGILCGPCNRMLGAARDDIKRLTDAILYLGKFK
jgi:hypothetical protein